MQEIITIDGKQFIITTDIPLTAEQKTQTITEIRKSTGTDIMKSTLGGVVQTLQTTSTQSVTVTLNAPANIFISDIKIGTADCPCTTAPITPCTATLTCVPITCTSIGCTADTTQTVVITFANNGDINGSISALSLTVGTGTPINYTGGPISVPANTNATTVTFSGVVLERGSNTVSMTYTWS